MDRVGGVGIGVVGGVDGGGGDGGGGARQWLRYYVTRHLPWGSAILAWSAPGAVLFSCCARRVALHRRFENFARIPIDAPCLA